MSITIRDTAKSPLLAAPYGSPKLQAEALPVFTFPETGQTLRVFDLDGAPWFVAADVCRLLGISIYAGKVNVGGALKKLEPDEHEIVGVDRIHPWPFDARAKSVTLISESGLYKLIMRSDKPVARKFQDWVTREVLPAIRRKGGYVMGEEKLRTGEMSTKEYLARALVAVLGRLGMRDLKRRAAVAPQ